MLWQASNGSMLAALTPDLLSLVISLVLLFLVVAWVLLTFQAFDRAIRQGLMPSKARSSFYWRVLVAIGFAIVVAVPVWIFNEYLFLKLHLGA